MIQCSQRSIWKKWYDLCGNNGKYDVKCDIYIYTYVVPLIRKQWYDNIMIIILWCVILMIPLFIVYSVS